MEQVRCFNHVLSTLLLRLDLRVLPEGDGKSESNPKTEPHPLSERKTFYLGPRRGLKTAAVLNLVVRTERAAGSL